MWNPFAAIGSTIGKAFGTEKALETGLNAISNGLDKLHYGKQEQAEDQMEREQAIREYIVNYMETTKGQNITRRMIALPVVFSWLCMFFFIASMTVLSVWVDNSVSVINSAGDVVQVNGLLEAADRTKPFAGEMKEIVQIVVVFYFGPHVLSKVQEMFKK